MYNNFFRRWKIISNTDRLFEGHLKGYVDKPIYLITVQENKKLGLYVCHIPEEGYTTVLEVGKATWYKSYDEAFEVVKVLLEQFDYLNLDCTIAKLEPTGDIPPKQSEDGSCYLQPYIKQEFEVVKLTY